MTVDPLKFIAVAALLVVGLSACAASAPQRTSSGKLSGGMLGLEADSEEFWADWTPREAAQAPVADGAFALTLFDAWRVDDAAFRQRFWDATFQLLNAVNMGRDPVESQGVQSVLMRLSAHLEMASLEVGFYSAHDGHAEGLFWRLADPSGAEVFIEAQRMASSPSQPSRWTLRVDPAFEQAPGVTLWWEWEDQNWRVSGATTALATEPSADFSLPGRIEWSHLLELLQQTLWEEVTGQSYVEAGLSRAPAVDVMPGYEIKARGLKDYVEDSFFWPRDGGELLENF